MDEFGKEYLNLASHEKTQHNKWRWMFVKENGHWYLHGERIIQPMLIAALEAEYLDQYKGL